MIVKFLSNKKGGSSNSINYLLDKKRVKNGTAKILSGNQNHTKQIIDSLTKKQKVSFGVMSFEEENISEDLKKEMMQEFEKTFFAGMEKEQYNILWVEHTDKGRLELNCVIPKIELSTGRSFNPYNHKTDLHLKDLFTKKMNLQHKFSDPNDPAKARNLQGAYKQENLIKDYKELDKKLHTLVSKNDINSRNEIIKFLKENDIKITRQGKDYISVKFDENHKAKRLKGGIYQEDFTDANSLDLIYKSKNLEAEKFANRDVTAELESINNRLINAKNKRGEYNKERYSKPKQTMKRRALEIEEPILKEGKSNDRIGKDTDTRARERATRIAEFRKSNTANRERIHQSTESDSRQLYPKAQGVVRGRKLIRTAREFTNSTVRIFRNKIAEFGETIKRLVDESKDLIRESNELVERARESLDSSHHRQR